MSSSACVLNQSTRAVLAYIQDSYHTDSSAGGDTVARQLENMEDKLDTILISLQTILPRLDKIDNVVRNIKDGQTVLKRKIKAVDATMAEHSVMVIATANETKLHLSREVLRLYEKLSEANDNLSSQSHTLTSKVTSLSTQTEFLTSSVDTLASNTDTLTTTVDLVDSRLSNIITSRVNSLSTQTQSLTNSFNTLSSNTDTLTTRVDLVASRMDGLASAVGSLGERTDTLTTTASLLVSSTEGLTTKVNFLDTQVYTLTSEVKIIYSYVKNLNSTVVSPESYSNNLTTTVTSLLFSNRVLTSTLHYTTTTLTNTVSTLNFQVGNLTSLYEELSEATSNLSSQSNALTIKVGSLSTQTQSLTCSVDTLSSNTGTLTTRVDLVASRMDGLTSAFTDSPLSIQVQNLTSLAIMAKDMLQDIRQYQTLSSIVDKIPYNVKSTSQCMQLSEDYPMANSGYYWMTDHTSSPVSTYCIITSELNPASSCQQLARDHLHAASDYYWVTNGTMQPVRVYCDMDQHYCNSTGGWVRVANIDMTDPNQQCPPGFQNRTDFRSCDRSDTGIGCTSITFPSHGIEYRQVCGRIRAYQYGYTYAFDNYLTSVYHGRSITIEDNYVHGMSLTHGRHPRQHIWTFASAYSTRYISYRVVCPCTRTDWSYNLAMPPFIGEDFFCDTAVTQRHPKEVVYADNPLWDGQGCGQNSTCCLFNHPPWFCKQLPQPTTNDLELRVCGFYWGTTPFDQIEIYIQ